MRPRKWIRLLTSLQDALLPRREGSKPFLPERCVVVGLGGIGSNLIETLCRFSAHRKIPMPVLLVEGKAFEEHNRVRQHYCRVGINKAAAIGGEMKRIFPNLDISFRGCFITDENSGVLIKERDIVFSCVDNHATRKLLSDRVGILRDAVLISGGNEFVDGNVQIHVRNGYRNVTPPITFLHDEILHPSDRNPAKLGCGDMLQGAPQLIITNNLAASLMLTAFWNILQWSTGGAGIPTFTELYFDIPAGIVKPYNRNMEKK